MSLLTVALTCAVLFAAAYYFYGRLLSRLFRLNRDAQTPAVALRDDVDYVPIEPKFLLGQHFSAIAAAGPIVGPILAGLMFGWLPALIWIVVGSIFIGGVHDFAALVASIRHKAGSIAQIIREQMTRTSYLLFMIFVWIALVYVVVAFTDIVANSFVGKQTLENGVVVTGGGIAASSMIYLALPVLMGLVLRFTKMSLGAATLIFLPLVGAAIWVGQYIPLDVAKLVGLNPDNAVRLWDLLLLAYCFVASLAPMWILLQPRGHLGGYFLYCALGAGFLGVLFGGHSVEYPAFTGWSTAGGDMLFPMLFITIACGACSGFHALIASGTTSKQLKYETDARPVGYGTMLLEGMVAVISLCCLMMLPRNSGITNPNYIYASGIGSFLQIIHVPVAFGISFGLLAFTTFVYDTLDVCTRLGRYILQELTGWQGKAGRWVATAVTVTVPLFFVIQKVTDAAGRPIPAWKLFWPLFGASNQLLAALTLLGITVWLYRTRRAWWVWPVVGAPGAFMYVMSMWALIGFIKRGFIKPLAELRQAPGDIVSWVALLLAGLSLMLLVEAARVFIKVRRTPPGLPAEAEAAL